MKKIKMVIMPESIYLLQGDMIDICHKNLIKKLCAWEREPGIIVFEDMVRYCKTHGLKLFCKGNFIDRVSKRKNFIQCHMIRRKTDVFNKRMIENGILINVDEVEEYFEKISGREQNGEYLQKNI